MPETTSVIKRCVHLCTWRVFFRALFFNAVSASDSKRVVRGSGLMLLVLLVWGTAANEEMAANKKMGLGFGVNTLG